ncbi:hypothetical protein N1027_05870 [Herbiconiux sp. CPCC 205763]|uniref:DUF1579 domain-containing protein n=1 Tax=Herbiconiux aconitum TaxID=2970913 RepID=A0ABT2GQ00_9MICO|nr:hypothetical protein [Herbiconiux aconitum]MCS5717662.1 hypothetical protein [Herbiconiux aconitum]
MPLDNSPLAPTDFDFIIGDWAVKHQRLKERLNDSDEWEEFNGLTCTTKTLGGFGNLEDNLIEYPSGDSRAIAIRSYNSNTKQWSIWWLDGRDPSTLGIPVVGAFQDGIGTFLASDTLEGTPIVVRFIWDATPLDPTWEQAFSLDQGSTWETNWRMTFTRSRD